MLRALAIETSGRIGSIALVLDDRVVAEEQFPHGLQHAAQIVPIIDRLCRAQGWGPRDLAQLYVSAGPGSFTGLRIGITLAKTMALATGVKVLAVPSVRVLAENAPAEASNLIIVLDAKRDQIFTARFERAGGGQQAAESAPAVGADRSSGWIEREPAHLDSLPAMLARSARPVHLLGEGIPFHEKFVPKDDPRVVVTSPESWRARAGVVATVGIELARRGMFADPLTLAPIYIRRPEAEEKLLGRANG
jgi:tRNA threonylcarbamoyladenosine biosynthesis protein TsaB